ncbi:polar amino acid transport system substrate-binding protein [Chitinivorax tropicus]|uniref:Polar amino acid transport system substrate-binding protein n=1 Tax=Chitinivorax tropicus TaxID=714531 RepID=A0A840MHQ8_9PROT|nr:transporter substrate-binding domain-containing protein [Chitinivorax tropicus]MBB5017930.1 polar amino acid transport system substrate-binding protein [Chitinivorax tropicus]
MILRSNRECAFLPWLCSLTIGLSSTLYAHTPPPLVLCFEDIPQKPWTHPDGSGLNLDLLRMVQRRLNEQLIFVPKPWKRCLQELKAGKIDGVIGGQDAPDRRTFAVFPTLPKGQIDSKYRLFGDRFYIYVARGSLVDWDGVQVSNLSKPVAIQSAYAIHHKLDRLGVHYIEAGKTAADGFRLMEAGVVDAVIAQGDEGTALLEREHRFKDQFIQLPNPFDTVAFYLFFSQATYNKSPTRIRSIWQEIEKVRESGEYKKMEAKAFEK